MSKPIKVDKKKPNSYRILRLTKLSVFLGKVHSGKHRGLELSQNLIKKAIEKSKLVNNG